MQERITVRVTEEMKAALERFHQDQVVAVRSRQDTFRYIIEDWLIRHRYLQQQSSVLDGRTSALEHPRDRNTAPGGRPSG